MDFHTRILQNDVEHLEKNMKTVFKQLVVLQEFIKQEFGSKFEEFCFYQRPATTEEPQFPNPAVASTRISFPADGDPIIPILHSSAPIRPNTRSQTNFEPSDPLSLSENSGRNPSSSILQTRHSLPQPRVNLPDSAGDTLAEDVASRESLISFQNQDSNNSVQIKTELPETFFFEESSDGMECDDEDEDKNFIGLSDDDDNSDDTSKDPTFGVPQEIESFSSTKVVQRKPRKKEIDDVWQKFEKAMGRKMQCRQCGYLVSGRRCRLNRHLGKCSASSSDIKNPTQGFILKVGRSKDKVRRFYTEFVDEESGITKSQCLKCGHKLGNTLERLRKHYDTCHSSLSTAENQTTSNSVNDNLNVQAARVEKSDELLQNTSVIPDQGHSDIQFLINNEEQINLELGGEPLINSTIQGPDTLFSNS